MDNNRFTIAENQTAIPDATITAIDVDADDTLTFSVSGDVLTIDADGVLSFATAPDFETTTSVTATVTVTDAAGLTDTQEVTVTVTNVNEAPTITSTTTAFTIAENQTAIPDATITATDVDADDTLTFSVSGDVLTIDADGVLSFATAPDFETTTSVTATVTVTDAAGLIDTQEVTVTVDNINDERPIITSPTQLVFEVPENFPLLTKIPGTDIIGYDPDGNEIIACSAAVLDGLGNKEGVSIGDAYLEGGSCYLEFGEEAVIDYESDVKQYRTLVAIFEKDYLGQSNPVIFTINITDVNEAPTITSTTTTFSAAENQTAIPGATITATDVDADDTLTFSVLSDVLTIDPDTGVLSFKAGEAPDFETTTEAITATVTVTDADGLFDTQEVTVTVTDVNEAPTITSTTTAFTIAENQTAIPDATITATDVDADDTLTFSVSGDVLQIDTDGVLSFATAPDFETTTSVTATVTVTDAAGLFDTQEVTVTVTNVNEAPTITSTTTAFSTLKIKQLSWCYYYSN